MRKIAFFALATALLGTVATVQANDRTSPIADEPTLTQTASNDDDDGNRNERHERADHRRNRHDEAREHGRKSHDNDRDNDQHEGREHRR